MKVSGRWEYLLPWLCWNSQGLDLCVSNFPQWLFSLQNTSSMNHSWWRQVDRIQGKIVTLLKLSKVSNSKTSPLLTWRFQLKMQYRVNLQIPLNLVISHTLFFFFRSNTMWVQIRFNTFYCNACSIQIPLSLIPTLTHTYIAYEKTAVGYITLITSWRVNCPFIHPSATYPIWCYQTN